MKPSSIVNMVSLLSWISVNGFTEEAEKDIIAQIKKGDIVSYLKSCKDISAFVDAL